MFAIGFAIGAILGGWNAYRRKGNLADIAQYMIGFGIAFGIIGMILGIAYARMFG